MLVGFIRNMCVSSIGEHHYKGYVSYIGTHFLFICMINLLSAMNFVP
jgi:F0F1-type ATP synthase membrane subunit a